MSIFVTLGILLIIGLGIMWYTSRPVALSPERLDHMRKSRRDFVLVDCRNPVLFARGRIDGAVNVPSIDFEDTAFRMGDRIGTLVVMYFKHGKDSARRYCLWRARRMGFRVAYLKGGYAAWQRYRGHRIDIDRESEEASLLPRDFAKFMRNHPDVQLVDVCLSEKFKEMHIKGAKNIPLDELDDRIDELPDDRTILFYCKTGTKAEDAYLVARDSGRFDRTRLFYLRAYVLKDSSGHIIMKRS